VATVYYSTLDPSTDIASTAAGDTTLLATINGPLYRDPNLRTAYPNERVGVSQAIYIGSAVASLAGQFTLFLRDGTVSCQPAGTASEISAGKFVLPPGIYYYEITSGTQEYFRKPGYVRVTVGPVTTGLRTFEIFLDPRKPCPTPYANASLLQQVQASAAGFPSPAQYAWWAARSY
jgi:hypothetical protein